METLFRLPKTLLLTAVACAAVLAYAPEAGAKDKHNRGRGHAYGHDRGRDRDYGRNYDRGYDRGYQRDYGYRSYEPRPYRPAYPPPAAYPPPGVSVFVPFR